MRMPQSVPTETQLRAVMLRMPPEVSLPMTPAPWPWNMTQLVVLTNSVGRLVRRPSWSRPDLITMQSSLVLKKQSEMRTLREESMSMPSLLGPSPSAKGWPSGSAETKRMPRTTTSSQ